MIIDLVFALIFFVGIFGLWYRITLKIPELVAVPDQVITERLHEDSAQIRLFILHLKTFYKEAQYKDVFYVFLEKLLYKFHIVILRIDNAVVRALKGVKTTGAINGNGNGNGEYWKQLQEGLSNSAVKNTHTYDSERSQMGRIQEVRTKKI